MSAVVGLMGRRDRFSLAWMHCSVHSATVRTLVEAGLALRDGGGLHWSRSMSRSSCDLQ